VTAKYSPTYVTTDCKLTNNDLDAPASTNHGDLDTFREHASTRIYIHIISVVSQNVIILNINPICSNHETENLRDYVAPQIRFQLRISIY